MNISDTLKTICRAANIKYAQNSRVFCFSIKVNKLVLTIIQVITWLEVLRMPLDRLGCDTCHSNEKLCGKTKTCMKWITILGCVIGLFINETFYVAQDKATLI